jgi:hypothetical protein
VFSAEKDPGATGATVQVGLATAVIEARILSKIDPWTDLIKSPDFNGAASGPEAAQGVWELRVNGNSESSMFGVFVAMATPGFIILL